MRLLPSILGLAVLALVLLWWGLSGNLAAPLFDDLDRTVAPPHPAAADVHAVEPRTEVVGLGETAAGALDPAWVSVRVIDAASGAPVADAEVRWGDRGLVEDIDLYAPEHRHLRDDHELLLQRYGAMSRSDARGEARACVELGTTVTARRGELYGELHCDTGRVAPPDGYRLQLRPDCTLRVKVVDVAGHATPEVWVGVRCFDADGCTASSNDREPGRALTDADGCASLAHLQEWTYAPGSGQQWCVGIDLPGCSDRGVAFDPSAPPGEPIVLQLPPSGRVQARVERSGQPLPAEADVLVSLQAVDGADDGGVLWQRRPGPDGWVHFDHVPLGRSFQADACYGDTRDDRVFRGPSAAGECVSLVFAGTEAELVIQGRLLDDQGQPVRARQLQLGAVWSGTMATDADGRFRLLRWIAPSETLDQAERVLLRRGSAGPLAAELPVHGLGAGEHELGDVQLGALPLLVAGHIVCDGRPWQRDCPFAIQRFFAGKASGADPESGWQDVVDGEFTAGEAGTFAVHAAAPNGRYRIWRRRWDRLEVPAVEFAAGDGDVLVTVVAMSPLRATLLLPEPFAWGTMIRYQPLALVPEAGTRSDDGDDDRWFECAARLRQRDGSRYDASWLALAPGSYRLEFRLWTEPAPIVAIEHVLVPPPAAGDPRLADIDLRGKLEVLTLQLRDGSGARIAGRGGIAVPLPETASPWPVVRFGCDEARLVFPPGPRDLRIAVDGFRPQVLRQVRHVARVTMVPWPEVELVVVGLPPLPEGFGLDAQLQSSTAPSLPEYRIQSGLAEEYESYVGPAFERRPIDAGRVRLQNGDAETRLRLWLYRYPDEQGNYRAVELADFTPTRIAPGQALVSVRVDAAALQRAIEELAKAK